MDTRRTILLLIFMFSLVMLWEGWVKHSTPKPAVATAPATVATPGVPVPAAGAPGAVPSPAAMTGAGASASVPGAATVTDALRMVVTTDLFRAEISASGGDLIRLELLQHKASGNSDKNVTLFDAGEQHLYLGQTGLIGEGLPTHKTVFNLPAPAAKLNEGQEILEVSLEAPVVNGVKVTKTYTFRRGSYVIDVGYLIDNAGQAPITASAYFQTTRDGKPSEAQSAMGVSTFTGPAVYTEQEKFQKVEFGDITKGKAKFATKADNGWIGMVQHYFVSAWLPAPKVDREFYLRKVGEDVFSAGVILPTMGVVPGAIGKVGASLYAGPQEQDKLSQIAPGLELVVDYGWLTFIAAPLFWVLSFIHKLVGNWGWSIIGLTVLIKAAFFPLSAASYKSMAKMRVVTPKLQKLKDTYGDDKARLNQEMMELYKREKINPLGGCLPILVQIPVFISLYWVLLGVVEMRNAPWLGWITDLSTKDPYYVMPLIMGATMLIQTKLNPTPTDPVQAKIMWIMPIVFTGMFLFFPSGLVLYWIVNNLLSIAQQWQINRMMEASGLKTR